MDKTLRKLLKQDREPYTIPRSLRDVIPIHRIWSDGIFQTGTRFAKTFRFSDINYVIASPEDKEDMLLKYADILKSLDIQTTAKLTINNRRMSREDFEKNVLMNLQGDSLDTFRMEYNDLLMDKVNAGMVQERYLTISVVKRNIEDARAAFARIGVELGMQFASLGSRLTAVDAQEKLRILHDFYRAGEEDRFFFDLKDMIRKGHDFRDYICPDSLERHSDYLKLGKRYARVLYLKEYATGLKDNLISKLTHYNRTMMLSIDMIPVPTDEAVQYVEKQFLGVETNAANWQRRQNANQNYLAALPYEMELQRNELKEYMDDLVARDQRMMHSLLTVVLTADSKQQLDEDTEAIRAEAGSCSCQLAVLRFQQTDGLNTVLPIGVRKIDTLRTMTSEGLSYLVPFRAQEIQEPSGIYFGDNQVTQNMILCNMTNLLNQSMFLLGVPGSGKSFMAKLLITYLALSTDEDIIVCDPEGEYSALIEALGGTVIHIAAGGRDYINAMDMVEGYGDNPIAEKSQYILSLLELVDPEHMGAHQKSIIDRCIADVYREAAWKRTVPTLFTLREKLLSQPEPEAIQLGLALELYTTGSQDVFAHETNVNTASRILSYNIHDLGSQLKSAGLLTITDTMINRVSSNWKQGKRTHIIVDEFHIVYENEYGASFFTSAWRQFRKRNAYPCAITQNVDYLLDSVQARTMLSNSEAIIMLNQAPNDQLRLAELLSISPEQMQYVSNAEAGSGLIRYGGVLVPFNNRFPRDTQLYRLITTTPGEGAFSRRG